MRRLTMGLAATALLAGAAGSAKPVAGAVAATATSASTSPTDSATRRVRFLSIRQWAAALEDSGRYKWQVPEAVVESLELFPGARVADIGAGTGYFNRLLARAVGDSGAVFAEKIEPALVEHMTHRAEWEGTPQVRPVLGTPDDPRLPDSLDLIFLCNTYRYIDARRTFFRKLRPKLKPSGRLVVIDFKAVAARDSTRIPSHRVVAELEAAGYTRVRELGFLPKQYFLEFRPAAP